MSDYPKFIKVNEGDETPGAHVANAEEHKAQLIAWHGVEKGSTLFDAAPVEEVRSEDEVKADLHALLDAQNIKYDKRWGVDKLKAALEE